MIKLIAAIGENRELGKSGDLIFHLKDDMRFFRETTTGHKILMGRKTFASIGRPLPHRETFVVTHDPSALPSGVTPVSDLDAFLEKYHTSPETLFVIGGATVYEKSLPYASELLLTEISASDPAADVFFPPFDKSRFKKTVLKKGKENDLAFAITSYQRI